MLHGPNEKKMNVLDDCPHMCLDFLTLPLPKHVVELLRRKLVAVRILNDFWFQLDQNLTSKPKFFKNDSDYVDTTVFEVRQYLFKYLGRVIELHKSLHLVIPATQERSRKVSLLIARITYDCLIFTNTLVPRVLNNLENF